MTAALAFLFRLFLAALRDVDHERECGPVSRRPHELASWKWGAKVDFRSRSVTPRPDT